MTQGRQDRERQPATEYESLVPFPARVVRQEDKVKEIAASGQTIEVREVRLINPLSLPPIVDDEGGPTVSSLSLHQTTDSIAL